MTSASAFPDLEQGALGLLGSLISYGVEKERNVQEKGRL